MRAWLEREFPPGNQIELPDGSGSLVFGRSARATLVFDDPVLSPRHCEVSWDGGFWKVRDLGTEAGTRVNGAPLTHGRALFPGDRLQFGNVTLRFCNDAPTDDRPFLQALASSLDDAGAWSVFTDHLLERGDPLGDRITKSRTGGRLDHMPWLGPLWDHFVAGELEIDWQWGFVRRAVVRTAAGRLGFSWQNVVATLTSLRVGQLLRELTIDVPRLNPVPSNEMNEHLVTQQRYLLGLPALPSTLERLSFGYQIDPASLGALPPMSELTQRVPGLADRPVYERVRGVRLRVVSTVPGVQIIGPVEGVRTLGTVTRIRRGQRNQLVLESPPGIPFAADGNPCYLSFVDGRCQLATGRMRGEVRVNNRIDSLYSLLPDDVIEVQGAAKLKFETY